MTGDKNTGDISPEERRGLNTALWVIVGLPLLFFALSMIAWALSQAFT